MYDIIVLFSSLHMHTVIPVSLEKSISQYPLIRNKYCFNRTSGVRTFQNSSKTIILNVACHIKIHRKYLCCDVRACGEYAQSLNILQRFFAKNMNVIAWHLYSYLSTWLFCFLLLCVKKMKTGSVTPLLGYVQCIYFLAASIFVLFFPEKIIQ